jgi:hypothetical protein
MWFPWLSERNPKNGGRPGKKWKRMTVPCRSGTSMPLKVVDAGGVDSQSRSRLLRAVVVAHGGARVGVSGGDLHVAQVDAGVEHGGDERVPQHVWVHPR